MGKKIKKFKIFKHTYDEVSKKGFEDKVNKEILSLQAEGKDIVTTFINTIGLSPVLFVITVVYLDYMDLEDKGRTNDG